MLPLRQKGDTKAGDAESCLPHFHSAIDDDIEAGYIRARVGCQEGGNIRRLLRPSQTTQPMIPALDGVWASEGSVLKLRKPFNDAVATQFLIRVNTRNLGGLTQIVADEISSMAEHGTTTASDS